MKTIASIIIAAVLSVTAVTAAHAHEAKRPTVMQQVRRELRHHDKVIVTYTRCPNHPTQMCASMSVR